MNLNTINILGKANKKAMSVPKNQGLIIRVISAAQIQQRPKLSNKKISPTILFLFLFNFCKQSQTSS
jgi:hypothetical protein